MLYIASPRFSHVVVLLVLVMKSQCVPKIPSSVEPFSISTYSLWSYALLQQNSTAEGVEIETILSPDLSNLVPADAPNPLYHKDYSTLLRRIVLSYLVEERVVPTDSRMEEQGGYNVSNLNGDSITFKRTPEGKIMVNDVYAAKINILDDGDTVYHLAGFLFDHQKAVNQAFEELLETHSVGSAFPFQ